MRAPLIHALGGLELKIVTLCLMLLVGLASSADARMSGSWGGNILVLDSKTGAVAKEVVEPFIFNGYTGDDAAVRVEISPNKHVRVQWEDVVVPTGTYKKGDYDEMGVPRVRVKRELIFSVPSLAIATSAISGPWTDAQLPRLPSTRDRDSNGAMIKVPAFPIKWDPWEDGPRIWAKDIFFSAPGGERLDCYEFSSGTRRWTLNLNQFNDILAGGSPQVNLYEIDGALLVVSDRLGMWLVDSDTGRAKWFLAYSNLDVIPAVTYVDGRLFVVPAGRGTN